MIGSIFGGTVLSYLGLKKLFLFGFALASVGSLLLTIFSQMGNITALLLFLTIFGFAMGFLGCYMNIVLLFPTVLKTSTMGLVNFFARLAGVFAPVVAELEEPINLIILVASAVFAGLFSQCIIILIDKK